MTEGHEDDWTGSVIGPWLVVEPFRDSRRRLRYRCINVSLDKVVGVLARDLCKHRNRMRRDGIEPERVDVWALAAAQQKVEQDNRVREAIKNGPAFE